MPNLSISLPDANLPTALTTSLSISPYSLCSSLTRLLLLINTPSKFPPDRSLRLYLLYLQFSPPSLISSLNITAWLISSRLSNVAFSVRCFLTILHKIPKHTSLSQVRALPLQHLPPFNATCILLYYYYCLSPLTRIKTP